MKSQAEESRRNHEYDYKPPIDHLNESKLYSQDPYDYNQIDPDLPSFPLRGIRIA